MTLPSTQVRAFQSRTAMYAHLSDCTNLTNNELNGTFSFFYTPTIHPIRAVFPSPPQGPDFGVNNFPSFNFKKVPKGTFLAK